MANRSRPNYQQPGFVLTDAVKPITAPAAHARPPCPTFCSARFAGLNIWPPAPIPGSVAHHAGPMPTINATVCTARPYPLPCGVKVIILTAWNLSKNLESFGTAADGIGNGRDLGQKQPDFRWDGFPTLFYSLKFTLEKIIHAMKRPNHAPIHPRYCPNSQKSLKIVPLDPQKRPFFRVKRPTKNEYTVTLGII